MKEKKYLLVYHKEDNDGCFSAAMFYNYLLNMSVPAYNITLYGCDYNDIDKVSVAAPGNKVKTYFEQTADMYDYLIMTDISFKADIMKRLFKSKENNFIWVDHHSPIIKDSFKFEFSDVNGIRDTSRSAILNAYKFLFDQFDNNYIEKQKSIELLRIMSGMDSWSFDKEGFSKEYVMSVNQGVTNTFLLEMDAVIEYVRTLLYDKHDDDWYDAEIEKFKSIGEMYLRVEAHKMAENVAKSAREYILDDDKVACGFFYAGQSFSQIFDSVKDKYEHGVLFKQLSDNKWTISLYNTRDDVKFHCGEYLKSKYGGGGHLGAAGCQINDEQMIEIIKTRKF